MTFQVLPREILDNIFSHPIHDWSRSGTSNGEFQGSWSIQSREAFEDLRTCWSLNNSFRYVIHDLMTRAIGKLDNIEFTELVGKASREAPADNLLVIRLAYDLDKPSHTNSSFKNLLLCLASESGRTEIVEYLLRKGAELHDAAAWDCMKRWYTRMTPLHYSVSRGHGQITQMLLSHGANVNSRAHREELTPLQTATKFPDILRLLLENGADVTIGHPLHDTAVSGSAEGIELLVSHGAEVDMLKLQMTPLMYSSRVSNVETTRKLVEYGANINVQIQNPETFLWGNTPLCHAITHRRRSLANKKTLEILLKFGADVNKSITTNKGPRGYIPTTFTKSPLAIAVEAFNASAVRLLLDWGAQWEDNNPSCQGPLQALIYHDRSRWCESKGLSILEAFLEHGVNPDVSVNNGESPLLVACCHRPLLDSRLAIKALLQWGADVTKPSYSGRSPLHGLLLSSHCATDIVIVLQDLYTFCISPESAALEASIERLARERHSEIWS